jgi:S-methylmethionine-dependent homocysteine/selenocysteine methylase
MAQGGYSARGRDQEIWRTVSPVAYRDALPQLAGDVFATDGGMETTLIFHEGLELPAFASFVLLADADGRAALRNYFEPYLALAREHGVGLVLDAPTWRANPDWGTELGYSPEALADANRAGVELIEEIRTETAGRPRIVISGCVGPRGDGYLATDLMTATEAERYHAPQVEVFARTTADLVSALTMTYADEAIGIVRAAHAAGLPVVVSFTVETDGRLPSGQPLGEAVEQVDRETRDGPAYFMINCAHPTHFAAVLAEGGDWRGRIRGVRANSSKKSHAELDEAEELDEGDPTELAEAYGTMRAFLPNLTVLGGCCGTDHRHIARICETWLAAE